MGCYMVLYGAIWVLFGAILCYLVLYGAIKGWHMSMALYGAMWCVVLYGAIWGGI